MFGARHCLTPWSKAQKMSKTTLFQKTEANIETFEKEIEALGSSDSTSIVEKKRRLDGLHSSS
jgi:hypothetical protein